MKMERYNNLTKDVLKNRVCTQFLPHGLDRSMLWRTKNVTAKTNGNKTSKSCPINLVSKQRNMSWQAISVNSSYKKVNKTI
jgi:hypothetical protein